ncbi:hypothetical protein [Nocardia iowensis]|uniref:Uncharacterized protein n=1 Tax=Nocardia iowensis TaxID=204891 RepID=A0ABX8RIE9_NOCIO|nr:hypothetical protein [Nocardia iowensis]QXN89408.1 hypothetical protein KV110_28350 [Nocardia iowensis]
MEHGQETGESIGAMLSSIAAVLREVSDKLDAVAMRVDGVDSTPVAPADRSVEARLAKLEAWAFGAGQDISGIDRRLTKVESGGASHAAPEGERAERPLPRAASRRNAAAAEPNAAVQRESNAAASTPAARESVGTPHEIVPTARENTATARENATATRDNATATRESVSRRYDSASAPRDAAPARDSAAHEANSVPQRGFSAPREPAGYEPAQNFTAPTPREPSAAPSQNFTAPTPREPSAAPSQNFTAPTPREPLPVRQANFTAPHEPAGSSYQNFTTPHEKPYESMVPSSPDSGDHGLSRSATNGAAPADNGTALTGAHRADEDAIPVDNSHVDKLQAMLDELKRTAAAPLGRSDVFGPPASDLNSTSYQPERSTETPRDYRLSSPPPLS